MKVRTGKILLVLKTPPPFGGGEILGAYLRDYIRNDNEFKVIEFSSTKKNKGTQGDQWAT